MSEAEPRRRFDAGLSGGPALVVLVVAALWLSPTFVGPLVLLVTFAVGRASLPGLACPATHAAVLLLLAGHLGAEDSLASAKTLAHWAALALAYAAGVSLAGRCHSPRAPALVGAALGIAWTLHGAWQVLVLHPRLIASGVAVGAREIGQLADGRPNSIFLLPGHLGALLAAALVLGLGGLCSALAAGRRREAVPWSVACLAILSGLVTTRSMASALLFGLGLVVVGLLALRGRARLALIGAAVLMALSMLGAAALSRAAELELENPAGARVANWVAAMRLIEERPVLGWGGGAFAHEYPRVRPPGANEARHAHQAFLEAAAEHGVGFAALLVVLMVEVGLGARRRVAAGRSASERFALAAPGAAAAIVIGHGLVDFGWSRPEWAPWAALLLGLAATAGPAAAPAETAGRRAPLALALASLLALLTLGSGLVQVVESTGLARVRQEASRGAHAAAAEQAATLRGFLPWSSAAWALEAEARLAAGQASLAVELAEEAALRSPRRGSVQALRARALLMDGRRLEAWLAAERAAALGPTVPEWVALRDALRPRDEATP